MTTAVATAFTVIADSLAAAGVAIAAGLFARQLWTMRKRDRDACFAAFRNNNWVGMALWVGIAVSLAMK